MCGRQNGSVQAAIRKTMNRPIRLTQCCTQFKSLGVKIFCVIHLHDNVAFIWKYLEQNVLFPQDLNWVQHWSIPPGGSVSWNFSRDLWNPGLISTLFTRTYCILFLVRTKTLQDPRISMATYMKAMMIL